MDFEDRASGCGCNRDIVLIVIGYATAVQRRTRPAPDSKQQRSTQKESRQKS